MPASPTPLGSDGHPHYEFDPDHPIYDLQLDLVGHDQRVLEFGCGIGHVTQRLVDNGCRVVGLELDPAMAAEASAIAEQVLVVDLDLDDWVTQLGERRFDVALLADVLEHLREPADVLRQVHAVLAPGGAIVVCLPNIAHVDVKLSLLQGSFEYRDMGLLDRTHLRFFTRESVHELLTQTGFLPIETRRYTLGPFSTELEPSPDVPQAVLDVALDDPDATTYQFVVKAVVDDGDEAVRALAARSRQLDDEVHTLKVEQQRTEARAVAGEHELEAMRRTRLFRYTSGLRGVYGRVRRHT